MDAAPEANSSGRDIAVVHLVRAANEPAVLARFLTSYLECPAGLPHRLVFLLKGFGSELPAQISQLVERVPHRKIHCRDAGYDISSYFHAAAQLVEPLVFFINSFSVVQGERWLSKLSCAYERSGAGLVGATGSWESMSFDAAQGGRLRKVMAVTCTVPLRALFPPFPNPHLRTNAFFLARKDFLAMQPRFMGSKLGAWLFESGRNSMTRQVLRNGRNVLVVGRDGSSYQPPEWSRSRTFWQSSQENLLIHDNRTFAYQNGDAHFRASREESAWGAMRE